MDAELTWRRQLDRLTAQAEVSPPQPLAGFHTGTLVIGVGSTGARILELVAERIEDTHLQVARPGQPPLHMICVRFDDTVRRHPNALVTAMPSSDGVPITTVTVDQSHVPDPDQKNPRVGRKAQWRWMTDNKVIFAGAMGLERYSVRVMLFNHLRVGGAAPLVMTLRAGLQNVQRVYIVASAIEYAGSSLIADLTALLRLQTPNEGLSITALVALEDKHPGCQDLDGRPFDQVRYRVAALHELSRLSQGGRVEYRYSDDASQGVIGYSAPDRLTYEGQSLRMLNGAAIVFGQGELGCRRIGTIVWSELTSQDFSTRCNTAIGGVIIPGQPPSVSIAYAHALHWPLRLLRKRYAALLIKYLIGDGTPPTSWQQPQRPANPVSLGQWLDTHHDGGLLDVATFLGRNDARYADVMRMLNTLRDRTNHTLTDCTNALALLNRPPVVERFVPPTVSKWGQLPLTREQLSVIRSYAGWEASRDANIPLQLVVGLKDEAGRPVQIILQAHKQIEVIWELALRLADRFAQEILQRPIAGQIEAPVVQQHWHNRYATWVSEVGDKGGQNLEVKHLELARSPFNAWSAPGAVPTGSEEVIGSDPTLIAQATVIGRLPVTSLRMVNEAGALGMSYLVDAPEVCTHRYIVEPYAIGLEKVPLFWRNLAPHLEALLAFLACATGGGLPDLAAFVNVNFPEAETSETLEDAVVFWRDRLSKWIRDDRTMPEIWKFGLETFTTHYEHDIDQALHERLQPYIDQLNLSESRGLMLPG